MAIEPQDDIVQDFLVESREILEGLGGQLVELEQRPDDSALLNAVFRGFHTVKGGAGFLNLEPLVEVCHQTEDIFNLLRQGEKQIGPVLMDAVLQALDVINDMFAALEDGQELEAAPAALLEQLRGLNCPDAQAGSDHGDAAGGRRDPSAGDISDQEFEALLDALDGDGGDPARVPAAAADGGDEITDDEFEALLDDLHGKGQHGGVPAAARKDTAPVAGEEITADEFEQLLDELHGEGRGPGAASTPAPAAQPDAATGAERQRPAARNDATVRVDTAKLDDIMNLVGELVLVRNRLATLRTEIGEDRLTHAVGNLELVTSNLQSAVMKTRMQPIRKVFGRFPRVVRDLARNLGKEVQLSTRGEETDLDKNLVEALADPLVHLVRNAVDHGMELPEERECAGKPRTGRVMLSAEQEGDHILLSIADDGRGMDPEALRRRAVEKGLLDADSARRLDDTDCYHLIFLPGFSTKDRISDVSGRGVGMDVVKNRISQLNGTVDIDSRLGEGSTIRIKVPLTLAILPTLMVRIRGRKFALPMSVVREIFELNRSRTNVVDGRLTVMVRQKAMPLFFLERWVDRIADPMVTEAASDGNDQRQVVTVLLGHQAIGFVVDEVIGLEEVVIKPLGAMLQGLPGLAGSTITGDGRIALIIDIPSLVKRYGGDL